VALQRNPESYSEEDRFDIAYNIKQYLMQSSVSISAGQESHYRSIRAVAASASAGATLLEHVFVG